METDPFPHTARVNKPYVVLLESASGRAAAYDAQHRLVTENASAELVNFALRRHVHSEPWDDVNYVALNHRPPSWAGEAAMGRCTLYWLRDGWSKVRDLLETPDA